MDIQPRIRLLVLDDTQVAKLLPLGDRMIIIQSHSSEVPPSLLVQTVCFNLGNLLHLSSTLKLLDLSEFCGQIFVDSNINLIQVVHWIGFESIIVTVPFKAQSQEAILLAPVTQIIQSNNFPTSAFVEIAYKPPNNCASEMTGVEVFCNVRG